MNLQERFRQLPSVDKLLQMPAVVGWITLYGRELVLEAVRTALEEARHAILQGQEPSDEELLARTEALVVMAVSPSLCPVINATGVVLHTNLGRAPLSAQVLQAMQAVGQSYSNLEYDLELGQRGSRYVHAETLLCRLTGAEAALVVNNNAGAVLLMLSALAQGREVIISRGQLVEIGGGFRIPDVMAQSGARLVEVGTTNRTYVRDFEGAINGETIALLRVHSSNFRVIGFTAQPELGDLVTLAHERSLMVLDDLGSGTLTDTAPFGLLHEPTVQESVSQGADLITFSGDKLLGGPQAGIIIGRGDLVERLRRNPLTRALRVDKATLAGIQANLLHYVKGEALTHIPIWRMIGQPQDQLLIRAGALLAELGSAARGCEVIPGRSMIGGGSLPEESLPTHLIALPAGNAEKLARALRLGSPAVVARIEGERVLLDLRTVLPEQEPALVLRLRDLLDV